MTAFRLSMGKALVPFAFVYSPVLLLMEFTWPVFLLALSFAVVAVMGLGAAIAVPAVLAILLWHSRSASEQSNRL